MKWFQGEEEGKVVKKTLCIRLWPCFTYIQPLSTGHPGHTTDNLYRLYNLRKCVHRLLTLPTPVFHHAASFTCCCSQGTLDACPLPLLRPAHTRAIS
ncbi:hypothetical protein LSAT2_026912 [Lamellibrachia satsuma]|nr:hypothetical protein LSAT2_026912 [Lamellibrachia satsuma]